MAKAKATPRPRSRNAKAKASSSKGRKSQGERDVQEPNPFSLPPPSGQMRLSHGGMVVSPPKSEQNLSGDDDGDLWLHWL